MKQNRLPLWIAFLVLIFACSFPEAAVPPTGVVVEDTPLVVVQDNPTPVVNAVTPKQHHIGVRAVDGVGEFYHRISGAKFIPRGMNYVRLAWQTKEDGSQIFGHSLFDPGKYDSTRVGADLTKMRADGYNVIRVFLSPDTMGAPTNGLSSAYMENIVDLLNHAKQNEIYVMFTLDWIPGGKYGALLSPDCCSTFALMNANFLPPAGLKANQVFYQDFIRELLALNAPTEYIWSYQLRNEMFYDMDQPPLSFNSGTVKTANGKTYDMSNSGEKFKMVEENNVYWLDSMRAAILEVDATALVSVGFFVPQEPHPARIGDPRYVVSAPAIWQSQVDFVDLHAYPGFELNLEQTVENFYVNGMQEKPIIMGEFGGEVSRFANITEAAFTFRDWQVESCQYGFDGWLFWTWDLNEQPDFFNALMQDGAINGVLAPVIRPDPCQP